MRIVIDLQGAQTESRYRGIGRYSLSLALAMARNAGEHEIWLVLNGAFSESILDIRAAFSGLIPATRIRVFQVPAPVAESNVANAWCTRAGEKIRAHFLRQLKPDVVFVSSLFEGYIDDAVTSLDEASGRLTAVTLYDLIPLFDQARYLPSTIHRNYYFSKLASLKQAGLLLAISESARLEAINALGVAPERVINISTAVDDSFKPVRLTDDCIQLLRARYGIERKIVMYAPGGFDVRKNFDGLTKAYALLPAELRATHQLLIVSKLEDSDRLSLRELQKMLGLAEDELVLTGYVSDTDLISLYNLATLFVFPSKHEGFGLPALEAMACGTPTIGSNTTSVPEVIGRKDALFDPADPRAIAEAMVRVLGDESFQRDLREHAISQAGKFSWDTSARLALTALAKLHASTQCSPPSITLKSARPRLAFISPLPPERSGISDYSAELLPALAKYYDIDVVVAQASVSDPWVLANLHVRSVDWFHRHAATFDRILYQFGNSPFHSHMFDLLRDYPGVVVLHDFFLSGVLAHEEVSGGMPGVWSQALYGSHGYLALQARFSEEGMAACKKQYPVNLAVLQQARGLIFHSCYSRQLVTDWYGQPAPEAWKVIPLLRARVDFVDRDAARRSLNIAPDDFVVCSFGFMDFTKLNHRLLDAWLKSSLAANPNCLLVFVGENHGGAYGQRLLKMIKKSGIKNKILISGWADQDIFRQYLAAADAAVQLRCHSRGETSGTALDCMNHGLPTIVNANGSMSELANDAILMLPNDFSDADLAAALDTVYGDADLRKHLSRQAQELILIKHAPESCAAQYAEVIESSYADPSTETASLIRQIAGQKPVASELERLAVSQALAGSIIPQPAWRQLFVDISTIAQNDLKTGIERVVRAQLLELLKTPPVGYRVEPVRLSDQSGQWRYYYACRYTCEMLGIAQGILDDRPIDIMPGDILFVADFAPHAVVEASKAGLYRSLQGLGVSVNFQVYDLLPVLNPVFFPEGAAATHSAWLAAICESASTLVCISESVADELRTWMNDHVPSVKNPPGVTAVHLGADLDASAPSTGLPGNAAKVLLAMAERPTFLMVGTIEPRKGHLQTLAAFEYLWAQGIEANLMVVGHEGWKTLPDSQRRTIPTIVRQLSHHRELNNRLFWLQGVSDEYLEKIYAASTCLIAASEGEGFGLPLIEAAQQGLPIMARDIPVFREVAHQNATYFNGLNSDELARSIMGWLAQNPQGKALSPTRLACNTWQCAAQQLISAITVDFNGVN
ncbi:MAG: hypothetical protein ACD_10C00470G0004 [uncultured bacterium]|nr:MAG: hypothetical protein ACD_10C00470G0004 [uncultured bacterium]